MAKKIDIEINYDENENCDRCGEAGAMDFAASLSIEVIDYSKPKYKKMLAKLKKKCEQIERNKYVDWSKLANTYITI